MRFLSNLLKADPVDCPYLPEKKFVQDYFFADQLSADEFSMLLEAGWRRFGKFFFRPNCPGCLQCIPLRVDVLNLSPTKSQRRLLSKGQHVRMEAVEPRSTDEAWRVYSEHSASQFGKEADREDFERTFFENAVPAFQTEYRVDGELVALGFLDAGEDGMSSAYFSFRPAWAKLSLGSLSVFREADFVRQNGGKWYYLGFWVPGCLSMNYKRRFNPHELLDFQSGVWLPSEEMLKSQ